MYIIYCTIFYLLLLLYTWFAALQQLRLMPRAEGHELCCVILLQRAWKFIINYLYGMGLTGQSLPVLSMTFPQV